MCTTINIVLFGIGNVGSTLIKQLLEAENQIRHILAKNNVSSEGFYKALQVGLDVTYYLL